MAPTAAMLFLLSHNGKTLHASSSSMTTMPPSSPSATTTTYFGLKGSALKWVNAKYNPVTKLANQIQTQSCMADPSAVDKRFEEALQLCSC